MESKLAYVFLDNTIKQYLFFLGTIILVILFRSLISKALGLLLFRLLRKLAPKETATYFMDLLLKPINVFIVLLAILFSFNYLNFPEVLNFNIYNLEFKVVLLRIYQIFLVFSATWILLRMTEFISFVLSEKAAITETKSDDQLVLFVRDVMKVVVVTLCLFVILGGVLKLNITSLIAGAGIAGIAIALAAQDSLQNLFGSLTIFMEKPFTVGDLIQVGDTMGSVEKVGFRSTRIRTLDKTFVTLPNRKVIDGSLNNLTLRTWRRVKFMVGVTYDTNSDQIKGIVKDIQQYIDEHETTNQDGIVGFHEFGSSSLDILVTYFIPNMEWNTFIRIKEEINFKIMEIVEKHGSGFAFPTQTIHLHRTFPEN